MKLGARAAAAIEILTDAETHHRLAAGAVKDWMTSHRFAGSKDRAAIGDLVFGALRWRASSAWRLGDDAPRAQVLGALRWGFGESAAALAAMTEDDPHAPAPLSKAELAAVDEQNAQSRLEGAPPDVRGDYPEWLDASFARAFGDARGEEGAMLAAPAPLDLRANTLKTTREKLIAALSQSPLLRATPAPTPHAPEGVRIAWARGGAFSWASDQSFQRGWFEVQDEGSQLVALISGAKPGMQVADICAGGGGKTLALAALMQNKGQIYAFDVDQRRLAPLKARADRAGARNVQIRAPLREGDALADLAGRMDIVLVDAPCSGSGVWRRNPESKWRLRPAALAKRQDEQQEALARAMPLVKPGGRLVYITCSVLPEENEDALARFLEGRGDFTPAPLPSIAVNAHRRGAALQLTPRVSGCDGFFIAALQRG
jgi:16S rRNA (cytosine967-C5)-methyltransferase